MYLVFDTETTGLPKLYDAPVSDLDNWPRAVQLAWETFDRAGRKTGARSSVIRPDGFEIPKAAEKIHGISTSMAKRTGLPIAKVLETFREQLEMATVVVAHSFSFDSGVVGAEFYRLGIRHVFRRKIHVCTMKDSTDYCSLPGIRGFKWPKLPELHQKLFRKRMRETHDAAADVAICSKCFFELKRLGVIQIAGKANH